MESFEGRIDDSVVVDTDDVKRFSDDFSLM
jgi:hypothetical protein